MGKRKRASAGVAEPRVAPAPQTLAFLVEGRPVPKGRPRAVRRGKKGIGMMTPETTRLYEDAVRLFFLRALQELRVHFDEEWPCTPADFELDVVVMRDRATGDLDNYVKAVSDALNKLAYPDDRYIFSIRGKMLLDRGDPHTKVVLRRWPLGTYTAH